MTSSSRAPSPLRGRAYDRPLQTSVHGHYWVRPAEREGAAPLLLGFHGYGENGEGFLASLEAIPGLEGWHLASVQALHPFYTRQGEVVASWMTRFDRELAIADNVAYARRTVEALRTDLPVATCAVVGFSQGVAMAYRAAAAIDGCAGIVALAGDVPPEIDPADLPPVLVGQGRDDTWYTDEKRKADLERLAAAGVTVEECVFDGGHEWTDDFRRAAARFLQRLG